MTTENGQKPIELYRRIRPTRFKDVLGQDRAVEVLAKWTKTGDLPHALLLHGGSGTGKTTLARIVAARMDCPPEDSNPDFVEVNCAEKSSRGIAAVENIQEATAYVALSGGVRFWILDEVHRLTPDAQASFLKLLEDCPPHCYFILCTTDPQRLIPTLRSRCQEVAMAPLTPEAVNQILQGAAEAGGFDVNAKVVDKVVQVTHGNGRRAVQLLEQVAQMESLEDQLAAAEPEDEEKQGIDLARALMDKTNRWADIAKLLKVMKGDAENIRRSCFGYAAAVLRGGRQDAQAALVMSTFDVTAIYDGMNQVTWASYQCFCTREKG